MTPVPPKALKLPVAELIVNAPEGKKLISPVEMSTVLLADGAMLKVPKSKPAWLTAGKLKVSSNPAIPVSRDDRKSPGFLMFN
jgi:hypothetical protein